MTFEIEVVKNLSYFWIDETETSSFLSNFQG